MAPNAPPLAPVDEVALAGPPARPSHRDLSTSPALLHELADTLDGLGSHEMARALRAEAAALAGRGPGCGLPRGRT